MRPLRRTTLFPSPAWLAVALLLIAGPAIAQQDDAEWLRRCEREADRSDRIVHCEVRAASMAIPAGALAVDAGHNGGVSVRGAAVGEVRVSARIQTRARTEARARELAGDVVVRLVPGRIEADGPPTGDREGWTVSFDVTVPGRTDLELSARNGPITVRDVEGRIVAETRNGPLSLHGLAGDVRGRTRNGPIAVTLAGDRWRGHGLDAETANGPITLRVPDGYSAELETGSHNGPMSLDFPVTVTLMGRRPNRIETTLGNGGPPIRVVTTNGPVSLRRP